MLAISTGGAAPLLTQTVRTQLETEYDVAFGAWVSLLAEIRPLVLERIADPERRQAVLTRLCQYDWLERIRHEELDKVRAAMRAAIDIDS